MTCCSPTRTRRSWPARTVSSSTTSCPTTTLLIENPGAVLKDADPKAKEWLDFVLGPQGQRQFALKGFRPISTASTPRASRAPTTRRPVPGAGEAAHGRQGLRSWSALSKKFFDEENGIMSRSSQSPGRPSDVGGHRRRSGPAGGRPPPGPGGRRLTRPPASGLGVAMLWFSLLVLIPLAAVVVTAGPRAAGRLLGRGHQRADRRGIRLTVVHRAAGHRGQRRDGHDDRVGPGARPVLRQAGRSRCSIDIPFALPTIVAGLVLLSLYGPNSPLGINIANTRLRGLPRLPVRHAAVRRADGAAGAGRARPGGRGGGGVAGRQPVHAPSGGSSCRA